MRISIFNFFHLLIAFVYSSHFLLKEIFLLLFSLKSCFLVSVLSVSAYYFFSSSQISNVDAPKQDYIFRSLYYSAYTLFLEILSNPLAAIAISITTSINFYFLPHSLWSSRLLYIIGLWKLCDKWSLSQLTQYTWNKRISHLLTEASNLVLGHSFTSQYILLTDN